MNEKQRRFHYLYALMDVGIIVIAYLLAYYLRFYRPLLSEELGNFYPISHYVSFLLYIIPIYLIIYYVFRLYTDSLESRIWNMIGSLTLANLVGMILFLCVLYLQKEVNISRKFLLLFFIINIVLGIGSRMLTKYQSMLRQKRS